MPHSNVSSEWVDGNLVFRDKSNNIIATINGTTRAVTLPTGAVFTYADSTNVVGVAAGYKVARGETVLDGSNPTSVTHGLTTCVSFTATLKGTAAPGDSTSVLTANINGAAVDVYAWKHTTGGAAGNPTLVASTGTESFYWIAVGT